MKMYLILKHSSVPFSNKTLYRKQNFYLLHEIFTRKKNNCYRIITFFVRQKNDCLTANPDVTKVDAENLSKSFQINLSL